MAVRESDCIAICTTAFVRLYNSIGLPLKSCMQAHHHVIITYFYTQSVITPH